MWDHGEVVDVDEGHDEWDEGLAAVVFGVGEDNKVVLEEFHLFSLSSAQFFFPGYLEW